MQQLTITVTEALLEGDYSQITLTLSPPLRELVGRRSVHFGTFDSLPVVVKRYVPHLKQIQDSQREWEQLKQLYALKLKVPQPLFYGTDRTQTQILVMGRIGKGQNLRDYLNSGCSKEQRALVWRQLFKTVATHHRFGVCQRDPHFDNFLWESGRVYALDANRFYIGSQPLGLALRASNLASLWVQAKWEWEAEMEAVLPCYLQQIKKIPDRRRLERNVRRLIPRYRRRRLQRYFKKTQRSCSAFQREDRPGSVLLWDRQLPEEIKTAFVKNPHQLIASGTFLKKGNTCTVAAVTLGGKAYVLKRYNPKSFFHRLGHLFLPSRARNSWSCGHTWRLIGLPTLRPWACLEEKKGPFTLRSFLLIDRGNGQPLSQWVKEHRSSSALLDGIVRQFTTVWEAWESLRARHGDLKTSNLLVSPEGILSFLDLDSFRFFLPRYLYHKGRREDWQRFMRNWQTNPEIEALFRERIGRGDGRGATPFSKT